MTTPSLPVVASEQINRSVDAELARTRKTHPAYFRGGASVPAEPVKQPPRVLIVRPQGKCKDYPLVGNVRPYRGSTDACLAFRDAESAADHARINGWNLRLELDKHPDFPWPTQDALDVTPAQIAEYEAGRVKAAA